MSDHKKLIQNLTTVNQIIEALNQAVDVRGALEVTLTRLVELMGLETGWIFLKEPESQNRWAGKGYVLAAHHNLPEAMKPSRARAWKGGCECQTLCAKGELQAAYNEVRCSRLRQAPGDRAGLVVHASAPLRSGETVLGILNVAACDWEAFTPESLVLLANVGSQMGVTLERARLFELLQEQRIHEQAALLDFSRQLLSHPELDDLMAYLVEAVRSLLQVDACALVLPADTPHHLAFYAASGWYDDPVEAGRRVPADERSGSGLVMRTQTPLLVEDLQVNDPTPWIADWFRAEGFRGHFIVPLVAEDQSIGVLNINTRQPRMLDGHELRFLQLMANQAAIALENARLHQERLKRQRLEEELAVGQEIQHSMLPELCPVIPGWEFCSIYRPAQQVGGDFYDFFGLANQADQLGLVIADVAGKGVPAALFMALSRTMIRTVALSGSPPAATLERANELILKDSNAKIFLSAFYAILETGSGRLTYTSAGHNWPLWLPAGRQECQQLHARGILLGVMEEISLEERTVQVAPGDTLVFYTDGITEAMNSQNELFGEERLRAAVRSQAGATADQIMEAIVAAVQEFVGSAPQADDYTIVVVKRQDNQ
ncbi:MAG: SpoIIE family protein phosphatase [Anaerolineae bacterium]|nr:SpoIIE family protein phosphatase [Anaerolineae bacterium]